MILKILPFAVAMLVAGTAQAQETAALQSRETLLSLRDRAIEAGRASVAAAEKDSRLDAFDRVSIKGQFARMLIASGRCDAARTFVEGQPDILGASIAGLMASTRLSDQPCAASFAQLLYDRADDPVYVPTGRLGAKLQAAAYLDQAGEPGAWDKMMAADAGIQQDQSFILRWDIRKDALEAYPENGPKLQRYLEYLADRLLAEGLYSGTQTFQQVLPFFAYWGRCDLVAKVMKGVPGSCDEPNRKADFYRNPPAKAVDSLKTLAQQFTKDMPVADEVGLADALGTSDGWSRITKLLFVVTDAERKLSAIGAPAPGK